jgi:hypothetical protein
MWGPWHALFFSLYLLIPLPKALENIPEEADPTSFMPEIL